MGRSPEQNHLSSVARRRVLAVLRVPRGLGFLFEGFAYAYARRVVSSLTDSEKTLLSDDPQADVEMLSANSIVAAARAEGLHNPSWDRLEQPPQPAAEEPVLPPPEQPPLPPPEQPPEAAAEEPSPPATRASKLRNKVKNRFITIHKAELQMQVRSQRPALLARGPAFRSAWRALGCKQFQLLRCDSAEYLEILGEVRARPQCHPQRGHDGRYENQRGPAGAADNLLLADLHNKFNKKLLPRHEIVFATGSSSLQGF